MLLALNEMHQKKYIHRDIKPDNILVHIDDNNNTIFKLGDFGFCKYDKDDI